MKATRRMLVAVAASICVSFSCRSESEDQPSSIAVLPLENASADPDESDYLADGISQAVITRLSQVGLRVTPWGSVRRYRGGDTEPRDIARELKVDAVLQGTFQLLGDRILTRLTLVDAKSGFIAWSEEFEEPYEDLFQVQRRIAQGAAASLKRSLSGEEQRALASPESKSVDAYDLYLQGAHLMQDGGVESTEVAYDYFSRAVDLDPSLAEAHVGLGAVHQTRYLHGWAGADSLDAAVSRFERAIELNPRSMRAHRGLSVTHWYAGRSEAALAQGDEARRSGREDDVETLLTRAVAYSWGGLGDASIPLYRRVIDLDPANPEAYFNLLVGTVWTRPREAVEAGERLVQLVGDDADVHVHIAVGYQMLDEPERAAHHHAKAAQTHGAPYALLLAGMFFDGHQQRELARALWERGVESTRTTVESYPDHAGMHAVLASCYGLLGDSERFRAESKRALESESQNAWELSLLALVEAKLGNGIPAGEILRRTVRQGRLDPRWKVFVSISSVAVPDSEPFRQFVAEYEALESRLRERYVDALTSGGSEQRP